MKFPHFHPISHFQCIVHCKQCLHQTFTKLHAFVPSLGPVCENAEDVVVRHVWAANGRGANVAVTCSGRSINSPPQTHLIVVVYSITSRSITIMLHYHTSSSPLPFPVVLWLPLQIWLQNFTYLHLRYLRSILRTLLRTHPRPRTYTGAAVRLFGLFFFNYGHYCKQNPDRVLNGGQNLCPKFGQSGHSVRRQMTALKFKLTT
jgi:hypothetical protein